MKKPDATTVPIVNPVIRHPFPGSSHRPMSRNLASVFPTRTVLNRGGHALLKIVKDRSQPVYRAIRAINSVFRPLHSIPSGVIPFSAPPRKSCRVPTHHAPPCLARQQSRRAQIAFRPWPLGRAGIRDSTPLNHLSRPLTGPVPSDVPDALPALSPLSANARGVAYQCICDSMLAA